MREWPLRRSWIPVDAWSETERRGVLVDVVHVVRLDVGVDRHLPVDRHVAIAVADEAERPVEAAELAEVVGHPRPGTR